MVDFARFGTPLDLSSQGEALDVSDFSSGGVALDLSSGGTALDTQPVSLSDANRQYEEAVSFGERQWNRVREGWLNLKQTATVLPQMGAIERGTQAKQFDDYIVGYDPGGNPIWASQTTFSDAQRKKLVENAIAIGDAAAAGVAEDVAPIQAELAQLPKRPATEAMMQAKSLRGAFGAFMTDPIGVLADVGITSMVQQLPALAATIAARNPYIAAAAAGGNSYALELGGGVLQYLGTQGIDTRNADAVIAALEDPEIAKAAIEYGRTRGAVVGSVDALSGGLASKTLVPEGLISSQAGREAANVFVAQPVTQGALGATGEAGAQLATEGEISSPGELLAEALGEFSQAPVEAGAFAYERYRQRQEARPQQGGVPEGAVPAEELFGQEAQPEGVRESAVAETPAPTQEDIESPIPTDLIQEGRAVMQDAQGELDASAILEQAGFPPVNSEIALTTPDGGLVKGTVADAFDQDGRQGAKIRLEDGRIISETFEQLQGRILATTQAPETQQDALPVRDDSLRSPEAIAPVGQDFAGGGTPVEGIDPQLRSDTRAPVPQRGAGVLDADTPADAQPALTPAQAAPVKAQPERNRAPGRDGSTASWVIRNKETGEAVLETLDQAVVDRINTDKYEAVAIQDHLADVNAKVRASAEGQPAPEAAQPRRAQIRRREAPQAEDVAVTPAGREVPVRYAVVEAADLTASQTDDGRVNPDYPGELQPRDRSRAVSQQQVQDIAQRLNPRLLDRSARASDGAPIVDATGIVESGNGRILAIRRAYAQGAAQQYRDYLAEQGYPVEGMNQPVLVRVREGEMTPEDRQAFTREANERDTLGMSATERAMADAAALPDRILEFYRGGDVDAAVNRQFVRAFIDSVVGRNEQAGMIAADGAMSQEAVRRIEAALLAKAYDDADLVASLTESADTNIKAIGGALMDVAPMWAQMRSDVQAGRIDADMDQTARVLEAARLVQRARREGRNVAEFVNQTDMLSGDALHPIAEGFLRLMFRNTQSWTQPAGREKLADALRFYLTEAERVQPGADLLGDTLTPEQILETAKERQYEQAQEQQDLLAQPPGRPGERDGQGGRERAKQPEQGAEAPRGEEAARTGGQGASAQEVAPATPATDAPLRIEDYTEKSVIVRGQTKENIDRIKEAGKRIGIRALWNKKAGGWVFPKTREAQIREALADLVGTAQSPLADPSRRDEAQRDIYSRRTEGMSAPELREYIEELRTALLTDERTGLGSNRAWIDREPKAYVASIDLDSLKWVNDNMGHDAGDRMIAAVGEAFREAGIASDAFHVSGDEFYVQADSEQALREAMARARDHLAGVTIEGNGINYTGPGFSYGIGTSIEQAEQTLHADKTTRETQGERAARGERPRGVADAAQAQEPEPTPGDREEAPADREGEGAERSQPDVTESQQIAEHFASRFADGDSFASITEARKAAAEVLGRPVQPGTQDAKLVDEAVELGAVIRARQIVEAGGDVYRNLVALYGQMPSLSTRTSTSVAQQAYSTPVPLAYLAAQAAGITNRSTVYEPTAGNGALLITANPANVLANELNPERAENLRATLPGASVNDQDAAEWKPRGRYEVVIGNPPFGTVKDADGQTRRFQVNEQYETGEIDHAIALKALEVMEDDGSAVLIVGSVAKTAKSEEARSDAYNGKAKREFYLTLYRDYNVVDHFTVAGELYAKQGAGWPVDVIVIRGRGRSERSLPAVSPPRQYQSWEALSEVLNAEYPDASPSDRQTDRSRDRGEPGPEGRDGRDRAGSREARAGGEQRKPAAGEPAGVREGPVDRQPSDARPAEPQPREPARPAESERPARRPRRDPVAGENARQVGYQPASKAANMGTLVPVNMQTAVQDALDNLRTRVGGIDAFVAERLGYKTSELGNYFGAEQVDAIALALDNMERGAGYIAGDQTGIGKGRIVAAVIRYALRNNRTPIFVTEKPNLYGDMYRDLTDIGVAEMLGRKPNILMTNAAQTVPLDEEGTVLKTGAAATHNRLLTDMADAGKLNGYDMVFTTYSQMQTLKGDKTPRMDFLEAMARGGIVIFDESHNAGGSTQGTEQRGKKGEDLNRATFARNLARSAHGVLYSSATYAKRPEVMDLYATTDMRLAVSDINQLAAAIQKGGVPMQQVVASMLAGSGQYLRRERSFDGVTYNAPVVSVPRETYGGYSQALNAIQTFSEGVISRAVKNIDRQLKSEGKALSADGSTGGAGAASTNFTSVMHNLIDQMLLSIKADVAADKAIEAIKKGEKPVITVANTMGSFIQDYVDDLGIKPGDRVDLTFNALLERYLERTRWISERKPFMKKGMKAERRYLTDEDIGPAGVEAFNRTREMIRALDLSAMPVSPIDHIRTKLQQAGYKVGEITGRQATLDYRKDGTYYRVRPGKEVSIAGRRKAIADFNGGTSDAMIINQAGSTGLSLHASKTFKDQRKRRMIIAQAEKNIDTHMQMLGRVHRTGQVLTPEYDQLVADVPAEKRPAAVLAKKMASLNANTTASRGGALMAEDVPDFMNQYGDEVAARVMADMPEIHDALGSPLNDAEEGFETAEAMRKVTGRIPLLPVEQQEAVYEVLESEYRALVEQKEAAGESVLEAKTLDLDARIEDQRQVVAPTGENSPFADGVYVEIANVKRLGKPHPTAKVLSMVAEATGYDGEVSVENLSALRQAGRDTANRIASETDESLQAYRREVLDELESDEARKATGARLDGLRNRFRALLREAYPGQSIKLMTEAGNLYGVTVNIQRTGKAKNPVALGSWKVTVALTDASRQITVPMSQLFTEDTAPSVTSQSAVIVARAENILSNMSVIEAFDRMQTESRETRTIITGNLLAGFDHVQGKGAIINFTDSNGDVRQGILMSRDYNYDKQQAERPVDFRTADQVLAFIDRGNAVNSADGAVTVTQSGGRVRFDVAASKARGGKYFLDAGILRAVGSDFVKSGDKMRAEVSRAQAPAVIDEMKRAGAGFRATNNLKVAREIAGSVGDTEGKFALRQDAPGFFSALSRAAEGLKQERGTAGQFLAMLKSQPGVKAEELEWTGLEEYLRAKQSENLKVTKQEIVEFLENNGVQVEEVEKGAELTHERLRWMKRGNVYRPSSEFGDRVGRIEYLPENGQYIYASAGGTRATFDTLDAAKDEALRVAKNVGIDSTKFSQYQLPGGENYREVLLTLPLDSERIARDADERGLTYRTAASQASFRSSHFDEPNILAHVRLNDRTDADGNRVLFVEEIQSDWHQQGRKHGYKSEISGWNAQKLRDMENGSLYDIYNEKGKLVGTVVALSEGAALKQASESYAYTDSMPPNAPFKGNAWAELAIKRVLLMAAEGGYDSVSWTTGDHQADRYDLSKHLTQINYEQDSDGSDNYDIQAIGLDGETVLSEEDITLARIEELVGKEIAQKISNSEGEDASTAYRNWRSLKGLDLKVGGEGMRGFYDRTLPNLFKKVAGKLDKSTTVDQVKLLLDKRIGIRDKVWSLSITDKMRQAIGQGLPLFNLRDDFAANADKVTEDLAGRLKQLGISDKVALRLRERIQAVADGKVSEADGRYFRGMIEIALTAQDGTRALNHEVIHALRDMGLIRDAEWRTLEKAAMADAERMATIQSQYGRLGLQEVQLVEEAIAEMYADWAAGRTQAGGFLRTAFERIRDFLEALGRVLTGRGYRTVDSVFRTIERGDVGRRQPIDATGAERFAATPRQNIMSRQQAEDQGFTEEAFSGTSGEAATVIYGYREMIPAGENYFGGIFGSNDRYIAESHGDTIQEFRYKPEAYLSHDDFRYELFYGEQSEDWISEIQQTAEEVLGEDLSDEEVSDIAAFLAEDKSLYDDEFVSGNDRLTEIFGYDNIDEITWALQGFKGEIARRRGYSVVGMPDEHGESLLILGGSGVVFIGDPNDSFSLRDQTKTEAFKRWFGDSKVVDENGEPLVVYHGTASDFSEFSKRKATDKEGRKLGMGWGKGKFYFAKTGVAATSSAEFAQMTGRGSQPNVMPVYLSIQKPISAEDYMARVRQAMDEGKGRDAAIAALDKAIRKEGYDGIVDKISGGYAVFEPTQIKSATGNRGTFDPENPDIRYALADPSKVMDPFARGGAQARQRGAVQWYGTQPLDMAFRLPWHIFGGINEHGEWKWGLKLSQKTGNLITNAKFSDEGRFTWVNPYLEKARAGLLDRYGLDPAYVERERERGLDERRIMAQVPEIMQALKDAKIGTAEAKVLQAVMTGEAVAEVDMAKLAEPIRNAIDDMGAEAVQLGLISAEAFERNRGAYLHRVYLKHETDQGGLARWVSRIASQRRRKIIGNQFKGRGLWIEVDRGRLMQRVPGFHEAERGGPVHGEKFRVLDLVEGADQETLRGIDPKSQRRVLNRIYLPVDAKVPQNLMGYVDRGVWEVRGQKGGSVVLWRDFTKSERESMGEIVDARYTIGKTYMQMAHDLSTGRFFRDIALNEDWATKQEPRTDTWKSAEDYNRFWADPSIEWVKVPDTTIPKSQTKRYGALAGRYVRAEIWRDMQELEQMQKAGWWSTLLAEWKKNKTARSPVVHMNNIMSNAVLMDLADVRLVDLARGIRAMIQKDQDYLEAVDNGAFGSDMVSHELRKNTLQPLLEDIERDMQGGQDTMEAKLGVLGKLADAVWSRAKNFDRKMLSLYQLEDEVFRMATYVRNRERGMSPTEAALDARDQFLNYDIRAPWINAARRSVLPFISYTYRAVPVIAHSMLLRPWKLAKYATIGYAINALAYMITGDDEDEERRSLRDTETGNTWIGAPRMIRVPWSDDHGNPVFLDIRRWIPAGDVFDMNQGHGAFPVPAPLQFGGPLMLGAELALNKQAFTGNEITNDRTDDWWDKTSKIADWGWKSWMPSAAWIPGSWYWEKIGNAAVGARDRQGRPYSVPQAVASSVGVKLKAQDVQEAFFWKGYEFDQVERELKTELRRLYHDYDRGLLSKSALERRKAKVVGKLRNLAQERERTFTPAR